MSKKIRNFRGKAIPVPGNDIDTDRIIPARFMKCVTFSGLGQYVFNDERVNGSGKSKGHPLDDKRWKKNPILLGGMNFGCGSSREHAPQALKDYGIQALIAESFAEIFAGNCSALGMIAVSLKSQDMQSLQSLVENKPNTELYIDLENKKVHAENESWDAFMPESYRQALLQGFWDSTATLAASMDAIKDVASKLPYVVA